MFILDTDGQSSRNQMHCMQPLDREWIAEAIFIFEGDCTCCTRNHVGATRCDKEFLRDPILGLYAELVANQKQGTISESGSSILYLIQSDKERVFPKALTS